MNDDRPSGGVPSGGLPSGGVPNGGVPSGGLPMLLLSDFRGAQTALSRDYFTDLAKTADLAKAFLSIEDRLTEDQTRRLALALEGKLKEIDSLDAAVDWLDRQITLYFGKSAGMKAHLDRDARDYLRQPLAWIKENMQEADEARQGWALVYLTVLCWIFSAQLDGLDGDIRSLMLCVCQGTDAPQEIREMRHLGVLEVSWDVDADAPLVRRLLVNPSDSPIELVLRRRGRRDMLVCMAAHSRWLSLWAGGHVTLLKGSITENGQYAYAQRGGTLQTLLLSGRQPASVRETGMLTDMAAGEKNNLYVVRGHAFTVPGSGEQVSDALAVFAGGAAWAVLRETGGVLSSDARLQKDAGVIAVVRTGDGLRLITREQAKAMDGAQRDALMDAMLSHLVDVTDEILPQAGERVCCGAQCAELTAQGELVRREERR